MEVQKYIRDGVAKLTDDQLIQQLAFLDTLLECDENEFAHFGFTQLDVKSLKSESITEMKKRNKK